MHNKQNQFGRVSGSHVGRSSLKFFDHIQQRAESAELVFPELVFFPFRGDFIGSDPAGRTAFCRSYGKSGSEMFFLGILTCGLIDLGSMFDADVSPCVAFIGGPRPID